MRILGIESSCDETGAAIIEGDSLNYPVKLLSNSLATSLTMHTTTGGIIPEAAAREQIRYMMPVLEEAIKKGTKGKPNIDAIAVTYGPGLIGSLLVGVETAKTLAYIWNVPIIPVNHLYGHIYANFIGEYQISNIKYPISNKKIPEFPAIALVVSGGHTDLVLMKNHGDLLVLGGTRDDACGEAFDKIGRLLGLSYPAGPVISKLAKKGNPKAYRLPRPMWDSKDFDFSFSGLKTSVLNLIKKNGWKFNNNTNVILGSVATPESNDKRFRTSPSTMSSGPNGRNDIILSDLCASVQEAIVDVLVFKTIQAVKKYQVKTLLLGGGVAANEALRQAFKVSSKGRPAFGWNSFKFRPKDDQPLAGNVDFFVPQKNLCTDNAAMIAAAGFYNRKLVSWRDVTADPELYY
jgi:N6-L-threonylcarbamoyladenine synthase